jgi:hypothetical protein
MSERVNHWLLRVGDGNNFINSSELGIWAVSLRCNSFREQSKEGDILWFIKSKDPKNKNELNGKVIAVATLVSKIIREEGPLICLTPTSEELRWNGTGGHCGLLIYYKNLYNLSDCDLYTGQKNQTTVCNYENVKDTLSEDLIIAYENICRWSKVTQSMK